MMPQKAISLNKKAYTLLKKVKKKNESYSELIIRLYSLQLKDPLLECASILNEDQELWDGIQKRVKEHRTDKNQY